MVEVLKIYLSLTALIFTFVAIGSKNPAKSNLATIGAMITIACLQLPTNIPLGIVGFFSILLLDPYYKTNLSYKRYSTSQKIGISIIFMAAVLPFLYFSINYKGLVLTDSSLGNELTLFFVLMTCVVLTLILKEKNGSNK